MRVRTLEDWRAIDGDIVYDNKWIRLIKTYVIDKHNRNKHEYTFVHFKNYAIGIIPITKRKYTYLVGQYRYPLSEYSWEIPEGGGSIYVDPLESAKRELKEEVGLTAQKWVHLLDMHLSNSATDEKAIIFLATKLKQEKPAPESDEILTIKKVSLDKAYEMVLNGKITDSLSVAGLLKLYILDKNGWLDKWIKS